MKTYIVDSFTDKPFAGNPAGVCIVEKPINDEKMLLIAQELGLSETAFINQNGGNTDWSIRFFSPKVEIVLCGHATLAAAAVLFERLGVSRIGFKDVNGLELAAKSTGQKITLEFPLFETLPDKAPAALLDALGLSDIENVVYNKETNILMLEISDASILARMSPDYQKLLASHDSINGVLVTAPSIGDEYDFHSRYFWPWSGTDEDPVTGGTHTFLAKYWASKLGKKNLRSFQSSKRTGFMELEVGSDLVFITSQAKIVFEGEMRL